MRAVIVILSTNGCRQVVDETFSLVGSMVLSAVSDPVKLVRIMAALLGVAFVGLLVGNSVSLAGISLPLFPFWYCWPLSAQGIMQGT